MGELRNIVTSLHESTKRDYLARMIDNKVHCMEVAKQYDKDYWDGDRRYGYGGYKYMPGRWKPVAEKLIKIYNLNSKSKVLDIGCGKGYLLHEMKLLIPDLGITGVDSSDYGIKNAKNEMKPFIHKHKVEDKLPYEDKVFDLVISLGVFHNLRVQELKVALSEMDRVGRQGYLMLESYRNEKELFNLQCWALTAESFFDKKEWEWIYNHFGYSGDYEFIYFTS
jgi:ubiquinone/menaquinone biosynthesis C-methylase UbiE